MRHTSLAQIILYAFLKENGIKRLLTRVNSHQIVSRIYISTLVVRLLFDSCPIKNRTTNEDVMMK